VSDIQNPLVGPRNIADGSETQWRAERTGAPVVQPAHGEYYEEASRGNVWTISTAIAGVVMTANTVVSLASSRCIVGIWNPTGGVNAHITRAVIIQVSGTAFTAAGFVWGTISSPTGITGTAAAGVQARNNKTFIKGGHAMVAFDGSLDVTGSAITVPFRYFGGFFPGAITAGASATIEEMETDIVVGPGAFAGLFGSLAQTACTVVGSLSWAEIPA